MKIVGVSCSPRKGKTTRHALKSYLCAISKALPQVETKLIDISEIKLNGCIECGHCMKKLECSQEDDFGTLIPTLSDPALGGLIVATRFIWDP